jgi:hypothetical protein
MTVTALVITEEILKEFGGRLLVSTVESTLAAAQERVRIRTELGFLPDEEAARIEAEDERRVTALFAAELSRCHREYGSNGDAVFDAICGRVAEGVAVCARLLVAYSNAAPCPSTDERLEARSHV